MLSRSILQRTDLEISKLVMLMLFSSFVLKTDLATYFLHLFFATSNIENPLKFFHLTSALIFSFSFQF